MQAGLLGASKGCKSAPSEALRLRSQRQHQVSLATKQTRQYDAFPGSSDRHILIARQTSQPGVPTRACQTLADTFVGLWSGCGHRERWLRYLPDKSFVARDAAATAAVTSMAPAASFLLQLAGPSPFKLDSAPPASIKLGRIGHPRLAIGLVATVGLVPGTSASTKTGVAASDSVSPATIERTVVN